MTKEQINAYYKTHELLLKEEISLNTWYVFCDGLLDEIMEEHKDVFVRLKNSGSVL